MVYLGYSGVRGRGFFSVLSFRAIFHISFEPPSSLLDHMSFIRGLRDGIGSKETSKITAIVA